MTTKLKRCCSSLSAVQNYRVTTIYFATGQINGISSTIFWRNGGVMYQENNHRCISNPPVSYTLSDYPPCQCMCHPRPCPLLLPELQCSTHKASHSCRAAGAYQKERQRQDGRIQLYLHDENIQLSAALILPSGESGRIVHIGVSAQSFPPPIISKEKAAERRPSVPRLSGGRMV